MAPHKFSLENLTLEPVPVSLYLGILKQSAGALEDHDRDVISRRYACDRYGNTGDGLQIASSTLKPAVLRLMLVTFDHHLVRFPDAVPPATPFDF